MSRSAGRWQRKLLSWVAVCMSAAVVVGVVLVCFPASATWTIGKVHGLWLKAFAWKHDAVFSGSLRVAAPAGWACDERGCYYYGFAAKPISYIVFSRVSPPDNAGQGATVNSASTDSVLIGGIRADSDLTTGPFGPGVLAASTVIEGKAMEIDFLGRQQDWALWKAILQRAVWIERDGGAIKAIPSDSPRTEAPEASP